MRKKLTKDLDLKDQKITHQKEIEYMKQRIQKLETTIEVIDKLLEYQKKPKVK